MQSEKRGVAANYLNAADYDALSPGVSWWYNWGTTPGASLPGPEADMDFVPMVWINNQASLDSLTNYLDSGVQPRQVFAINEPNLRGQAYITPEQTAVAYNEVRAIAHPHGVQVSGPHMAAGCALADCVTAPDPITGEPKTYTYMGPFVEDFLYHMGSDPVDSIGYHFYGNFSDFDWLLGEAKQQADGRPLWITEFNWSAAPSVDAAIDYLVRAVDRLERDPQVAGYSWFKERGAGLVYDLLSQTPGVLSALGEAYVNMPVHDADVWYRPNGRLQAERYVDTYATVIGATGDSGGLADLVSSANGAWLDYNLYGEYAGDYEVTLRYAGEAGELRLLDGQGARHDSAYVTAGVWRTVTLNVSLDAGFNSLRLEMQNYGQLINWLDFQVVALAGDYNTDGVVDAADYTVWRDKSQPTGGYAAQRHDRRRDRPAAVRRVACELRSDAPSVRFLTARADG